MKLRHRLRRPTPRWWITRYRHNRGLLDEYLDAHPDVVEMRHINRVTEGVVVEHSGNRATASQHTDR